MHGRKNISTEFFESFSDEELAVKAKKSDTAMLAIITRMMPLIHQKVNINIKQANIEHEDLIQEGLIGLVSAVRTFSLKNGAGFKTYAGICIENSIRTAVRKLYRQKNLSLNNYVSLNNTENNTELSGDMDEDPIEKVIISDELSNVWNLVKSSLSSFEYNVFVLYLSGVSYENIAAKVSVTKKSVDNALQRIRRKLQKMMSENEFN